MEQPKMIYPAKLKAAALAAVIICFAGGTVSLAEENPPKDAPDEAQKPDDTPWGEAVDGVACRVLVRSNYCVGEKIVPIFEFKNDAEEDRLVFNLPSCYC